MKRLFDLLLVVVTVILIVPIILVTLAVYLTSKDPALYWSDRVGKDNKIFKMSKFRSMKLDTPAVATYLLDGPKSVLMPIGDFLRKSSLDELPIPQKVGLDVEYMQKQSFFFDIYILWLTLIKVVRKDRVSN